MTGAARPRVSVAVLTHNRRGELLDSLDRLAALPERPRIVLVDNASTDGTAETVRRRFPDLEVITLQRNIGGAARNVAVRRLDTPYVAFCDDDSSWAPGSLDRAADLLDGDGRLAIVAGRVLVGAEGREDPTCALMAASPLPGRPGLPGRPVLGFLACASVVRRSAFLAAGGFEPRMFVGGEEALLAIDLLTAGWDIAYVEDVVAHHYPSPHRDPRGRRRVLLRNHLWVAWLRRPAAGTLRETAGALRSVTRDPALLPGLLAALGGLPWAVRHRRVVPPRVEAALRLVERSR